jgi:hypothetical protein
MTNHEIFKVSCLCGKTHERRLGDFLFRCDKCGRKSFIDLSGKLSESELTAILDSLDAQDIPQEVIDTQKDKVAKVIEITRDRSAA